MPRKEFKGILGQIKNGELETNIITIPNIKTCRDVDKWANELQASFRIQDAINAKLKKETHDLKWFLS